MTWTAPEPAPLADQPTDVGERETLVEYLRFQRHTLLNICAGLTADQLALQADPPSTLTLLGLVRHLAKVERIWFRQRAALDGSEPLYGGAGDPEDFAGVDPARAAQELQQLQDEWAACDTAVRDLPLEHVFETRHGPWNLRLAYVHVIAEYARHNGHADLLRQSVDGVTGR